MSSILGIPQVSEAPAHRQSLSFGGEELGLPSEASLLAHGILQRTLLRMKVLPGQEVAASVLTVRMPSGHLLAVGFAEDLTLSWLKAQLQECTGVEADDQKFFLSGRPLLSDLTFGEYGIRPGCVLQLVVGGSSASALWSHIDLRLAGRPPDI